MKLFSPAFLHEALIPSKFTCDGKNVSPELHIEDVPLEAKSLVLIMEDPDVPEFVREDRLWVHWVIFNIPPEVTALAEDCTPPGVLGTGTGGKPFYQGPCPPDREHRYFFKLYALDCELNLLAGASKDRVEKAMQGHVLAETHLMGRYTTQNS